MPNRSKAHRTQRDVQPVANSLSSPPSSSLALSLPSTSPPQAKKRKFDQESKRDFSAPWHFSDVVLVVEGRKFHVHRSTLSMWSPVFETMFISEFKEKTLPEIPLPVKSASEIQALLQLIYSRREQVTEQNFEILLKLADEYEMKEVIDLCVTFMNSILNRETSLHLYGIAVKYRLEEFVKKCLDEIKFLKLEFISKSKHFLELELIDQFHIISCKAKTTEDALGSNNSKVKHRIFRSLGVENTIKSCEKCQSDIFPITDHFSDSSSN